MKLKLLLLFLIIFAQNNYGQKILKKTKFQTYCYVYGCSNFDHYFNKFDPKNCDSLVYIFVNYQYNLANGSIIRTDFNEQNEVHSDDCLRKMILLGKDNNVQVIVRVDGWLKEFQDVLNEIPIEGGIKAIKNFIKRFPINGIDFDHEFEIPRPGFGSTFQKFLIALKENFPKLNFYGTFKSDAELYDLSKLNQLDYLFIKCFNYFEKESKITGLHSALYSKKYQSVEKTINKYIIKGIKPQKMILGVANYGRSQRFKNEVSLNSSGIGEESIQHFGIKGNLLGWNGHLSYAEICLFHQESGWITKWDEEGKVLYSHNGTDFISYENATSLKEKAIYALEKDLGGIIIDDLIYENLHEECNLSKYFLMEEFQKELLKLNKLYNKSSSEENEEENESFNEVTISNNAFTPIPIIPNESSNKHETHGESYSDKFSLILGISISVFVVVIMALIIVVYILWKKTNKVLSYFEIRNFIKGKEKELEGNNEENVEALTKPYDDNFEIPQDWFTMKEILGSGAYGVVRKGILKSEKFGNESIEVAIKSIKKNASPEYMVSLLSELKILIHLGKHPNIINLIGSCTKNIKQMEVYILLELCKNGSLENILIKRRDKVKNKYQNLSDEENLEIKNCGFSIKNLITWSMQIANGMEFIAAKKIIHGDLAIRNILLDDKFQAKITDFGLSKQIYNYSNYVKNKTKQMLPWRSMAIESLRDLKFSTKSDVWSFGVTLWEIFSLAQVPYSDCAFDQHFIGYLENGNRLLKPKYASDEIYEIMKSCWIESTNLRPKFHEIWEKLEIIIESNKSYA